MSNQSWSNEEQETIVNIVRADDVVHIWSNIPAHVRAFSKKPSVTTIETGTENGQPWGKYTIPKSLYNPAMGVKRTRKPMTPEQKAALAERLAKARAEAF